MVGKALMDKKRGQSRWEQGIPGWYSSKSPFLSSVRSSEPCVLTAGWTMPLSPYESRLNHVQSLANGGCGSGGVTDRPCHHLATCQSALQDHGGWERHRFHQEGIAPHLGLLGELRREQLSHCWEANVEGGADQAGGLWGVAQL